MSKFARMAVAFAFFGALAIPSAMAKTVASANGGFTVSSGKVTATYLDPATNKVVTKTFGAGEKVPDQAVVQADENAVLTSGTGMTITVSQGTKFQAATTSSGQVDVHVMSGSSVQIAGYGHSASVPVGAEVNTGGGDVQVIKAGSGGESVVVTNQSDGSTTSLGAGQQTTTQAYAGGSFTNVGGVGTNTGNSILTSPVQNVSTTLSPSTP